MFIRLREKHPGTAIGALLFYELGRYAVMLPLLIFGRMRWFHADRVPAHGAVLLVANHQSHLDPPLIGIPIFHRHLDFIAKVELFGSRIFGAMLGVLNCLPIRDEVGDARAIKESIRRLEAGRAVLMFPEGTRTPDGTVEEFLRGVAVLVKRSRCPVLPIAVEGCYDAWPRGKRIPRLFGVRVAVMYGEPIGHDDLMSGGPDAALARLRGEIDRMRLELREKLRIASGGRYPERGPADEGL